MKKYKEGYWWFGKQTWPGYWGHLKFSRTFQVIRKNKRTLISLNYNWNEKWATLNIGIAISSIGYLDIFLGLPWFSKPIEWYE